jgi:hypothetical protein
MERSGRSDIEGSEPDWHISCERVRAMSEFQLGPGGNGPFSASLPLSHGAHDQCDEARRHGDSDFRFDG